MMKLRGCAVAVFFFCSPSSASRRFDHALVDPRRGAAGRPSPSHGAAGSAGLGGIGRWSPVVEQLLAHLVRRRSWKGSCGPRRPCGRRAEPQKLDQVRRRRRLEDHRVLAGLDRLGVPTRAPPSRWRLGDRSAWSDPHVVGVLPGPAGAGAVLGAHGEREATLVAGSSRDSPSLFEATSSANPRGSRRRQLCCRGGRDAGGRARSARYSGVIAAVASTNPARARSSAARAAA